MVGSQIHFCPLEPVAPRSTPHTAYLNPVRYDLAEHLKGERFVSFLPGKEQYLRCKADGFHFGEIVFKRKKKLFTKTKKSADLLTKKKINHPKFG